MEGRDVCTIASTVASLRVSANHVLVGAVSQTRAGTVTCKPNGFLYYLPLFSEVLTFLLVELVSNDKLNLMDMYALCTVTCLVVAIRVEYE